MSDAGSDSDATVADSGGDGEDDGCADNSAEDAESETALSLQSRQKTLFDRIKKCTAETAAVQNVQELQEEYLILERSLCQLSRVVRQERKQLSDELEATSVANQRGCSFQQRLLQLSDKQKMLLQCFDSQKKLGVQLKLLSSQSRYSTRSKALMQQARSQGMTSSGCQANSCQTGKAAAFNIAMVSRTYSAPVKQVQPAVAPLRLPSSSQLTSGLINVYTSKTSSTKSSWSVAPSRSAHSLQQSTSGIAKSQQSVGVAAEHMANNEIHQSPEAVPREGVATDHEAVDEATQQSPKPVGVAAVQEQPVGVAVQLSTEMNSQLLEFVDETVRVQHTMSQQQRVGVAKQVDRSTQKSHQPECVSPQQQESVGVAEQQMVGTSSQKQGVDLQQHESMGMAEESTGSMALKQHVLIPKNQQLMPMQKLGGVASKQQTVGVAPKFNSELAQPVPLNVLIQYELIIPQDRCLSCTLMGCQFIGTLAKDGSINSQDGRHFSSPAQWIAGCWVTLGHHKRADRRTAYTKVNYKGRPLLHYCLQYNQQKVSNYLSRSHGQTSEHPRDMVHAPDTQLDGVQPEGVLDMTCKCQICLIADQELILSNECLPPGFWECSDTVIVNNDIENDVNF